MAKAKPKRNGRRKGSRNRGYFFIKDRGWVANVNGRRVPLEYENGEPTRIQELYSIKATRIEPVGLVYLWPVTG